LRKTQKSNLPFKAADIHDWLSSHAKEDIWGGLASIRLFMAVQHKELVGKILVDTMGLDKNGCYKFKCF